MRLATTLGFDYSFELGGTTYTIHDIVKGEYIRAGAYHEILKEAEGYYKDFLVPTLNEASRRLEIKDKSPETMQRLINDVSPTLSTKIQYLDISWFIELAARDYAHTHTSFDIPLQLGQNGQYTVSMDSLVMSQVALWEERKRAVQRGGERNPLFFVPLVESGLHMIDMFGTVIHLFENDPKAQSHLNIYQQTLTEMYELFFTTFQTLDFSAQPGVISPNFKLNMDGHMLQFIFDPESWKPADYALDKLDVIHPKTRADRNVASLIERLHVHARQLKPGEDFNPSTHLYAGFRNLQRYLETK